MKKRSQKGTPKDVVKKSSSEITLDLFVLKCVREGKIRSWQKKEIATFFKEMKLKEKEDLEVYEAMLGKY